MPVYAQDTTQPRLLCTVQVRSMRKESRRVGFLRVKLLSSLVLREVAIELHEAVGIEDVESQLIRSLKRMDASLPIEIVGLTILSPGSPHPFLQAARAQLELKHDSNLCRLEQVEWISGDQRRRVQSAWISINNGRLRLTSQDSSTPISCNLLELQNQKSAPQSLNNP